MDLIKRLIQEKIYYLFKILIKLILKQSLQFFFSSLIKVWLIDTTYEVADLITEKI